MSTKLVKSRMTRVLGLTNTGLIIRPISGSEETDEERRRREEAERGNSNNGNNSGGNGDGGGSNNGNGEGSNSGGDGTDGNGSQQQNYPGESDAEMWKRRAEASDRKQGELQKEIDKFKAANQSELERAQTTIASHEQTIAQLTEQRDNALIQAEILKFPGYDWQDPDVLLRLIDRKDIEIDKDGGITGVKPAVEAAAKGMPYLLKSDPKKKDDKTGGTKEEHKQQQNGQASGGQPSNGTKPDDKNARREELTNKYNLGVY